MRSADTSAAHVMMGAKRSSDFLPKPNHSSGWSDCRELTLTNCMLRGKDSLSNQVLDGLASIVVQSVAERDSQLRYDSNRYKN